ncbi:MAG: hypothetical protein ACRCZB_01945 [Bacteroidales bacterium]
MNCATFPLKQWIIFDYGLSTAIGFADYRDNTPSVLFVTDMGEMDIIAFEEVCNPRRLCIESKTSNNIRKLMETIPHPVIRLTIAEA